MDKINYESLDEEKEQLQKRYDKLLKEFNVLQGENDFNLQEIEQFHQRHQEAEEDILALKQENADLLSQMTEMERDLN